MSATTTLVRVELPVIPAPEQPRPAPSATTRRKPARKTRPAPPPAPQLAEVQAPAPAPEPIPAATADLTVTRWATFGVGFTLLLSAALNGYANAQHAPLAFAGWLMGLAVPVLVLVLSKVAGEKFRHGHRGVAWFAGLAGVALLFLSVWHCSQSIALLTGSPVALSMPMAVAIDAGLVACELAIITEPRA